MSWWFLVVLTCGPKLAKVYMFQGVLCHRKPLTNPYAYLGRVTLTNPEEMISTDFPQNLFFHL